jgi:hypothetical protein
MKVDAVGADEVAAHGLISTSLIPRPGGGI